MKYERGGIIAGERPAFAGLSKVAYEGGDGQRSIIAGGLRHRPDESR